MHRRARLLASEAARHPAALFRSATAMHFDAVERFAWLEKQLRRASRDLEAAAGAFHHAVFGEMPGAPHAMLAVTTQHVGHFDELPARIVNDLAPVRHRVRKPLVSVVFADEALPLGTGLEFDAACLRVLRST